jgi:hypothetical protein
MSNRRPSSASSQMRDTVTVAAGLFGGLITGVSLGFLLWQLV